MQPETVVRSERPFDGKLIRVRVDTVRLPDGRERQREVVEHPGAVGVLPVLTDGTLVLVRQYRHPLRQVLWELPAGLRDVDGEDPAVTAARELAEEAGLVAARWEPLVTMHSSPGCSDEEVIIYLAGDLAPVAEQFTYSRVLEESTMTVHRVPLDEAVGMVERGEITNGVCALGLLAAWRRVNA